MSITNFNTENNSFSKLISDTSMFKIPKFQRDYSWGNEEWEELWDDIEQSIKDEEYHYMGYLVLQSMGKNVFNIIDGQQRVTTLSLVILAAMKNLNEIIENNIEADNNRKRLDNIRTRFIGYQDNVTLVNKNKLTLNRNNDRYYKDYIVTLEKDLPKRNFNESEHLLRKSFTFFYDKIKSLLSDIEEKKRGEEIASFVESIVNNLFFTVITVTNELNAYKVFETLNARGVKLSSTDLLKNYLFSIIDNNQNSNHEEEVKELDEKWNKIVSRLGNSKISDYLRVFWLSKYEFVRHINLFKNIRNTIKTREEVFKLVSSMDLELDAYLLCISPDSEPLDSDNKSNIDAAKLMKLFRIKQHYPIIMAAKRRLNKSEFKKAMKYLSIITFRYTVIGNQPQGDPEMTYFKISQDIEKGKIKNSLDIARALKIYYLSDKEFKSYFENKSILTKDSKNNKIAKYIYAKIEEVENGLAIDPNDASITIEHILPQNPGGEWDHISENEKEKSIYHIGNMMLLEKSINKDVENKGFSQKLNKYKNSKFKQVTYFEHNNIDKWKVKDIEKRASYLAKLATEVWKISNI